MPFVIRKNLVHGCKKIIFLTLAGVILTNIGSKIKKNKNDPINLNNKKKQNININVLINVYRKQLLKML